MLPTISICRLAIDADASKVPHRRPPDIFATRPALSQALSHERRKCSMRVPSGQNTHSTLFPVAFSIALARAR
jgi:hypothetical protein